MKFRIKFKKLVVVCIVAVTLVGMFLAPESVKELAMGCMMGCFAVLEDTKEDTTPSNEEVTKKDA